MTLFLDFPLPLWEGGHKPSITVLFTNCQLHWFKCLWQDNENQYPLSTPSYPAHASCISHSRLRWSKLLCLKRAPCSTREGWEQTERMKMASLEQVLAAWGACLCVGFHKKRHMAPLSQQELSNFLVRRKAQESAAAHLPMALQILDNLVATFISARGCLCVLMFVSFCFLVT